MDLLISKITTKSQTVLPQKVRKALSLKPGDYVRYSVKGKRVEIEKLGYNVEAEDNPFISFTEWASEADEEAFKDL